ncbi:MAG TPA: AAA family ATPase [Saprospiraceae bacterium]|nr:AAA family ATPase [Saprospiraceae bacterium]
MKIGISNLKGGVGKTTVSQNLAVGLAHVGYKVCIVDTDRNQNSVSWVGERSGELPSILAVGVTDTKALNKMADQLEADHDFIIIDGTPSLSEMTTRIILSSDLLIIPILPSGHDIRSMQIFFERYEQAKEFRENIPAYFFINQYSETIKLHQSTKELLNDFGIGIMETKFNRRVAYAETSITGQGVYEYSDEKAKAEVTALTKEVLEIAKKLGYL